MKRHFIVKPLAADRVDAAFPIVQAAVPGLTLDGWRQFAASAAARGDAAVAPSILVVENERGYVQGFCTFRLQRDIRRGTVFAVDDLVTLDLIGGAAAAALVDALEARARRLGCGAVRLHLSEAAQARLSRPVLRELLRRSGRPADAVRLVAPVDLVLR